MSSFVCPFVLVFSFSLYKSQPTNSELQAIRKGVRGKKAAKRRKRKEPEDAGRKRLKFRLRLGVQCVRSVFVFDSAPRNLQTKNGIDYDYPGYS